MKTKIINWIKNKLGILKLESTIKDNQAIFATDLCLKEQSTIIVISHLNGGQIRIIPFEFKDFKSYLRFVEDLKDSYEVHKSIIDAPSEFKRFID
jgi:hypothetical protein